MNDAKGSGYSYSRGDKSRKAYKLPGMAGLAAWGTPTAQEFGGNPEAHIERKRRIGQRDPKVTIIPLQARLVDSGITPNGSPSKTESAGRLNPALSRWLMGLPREWDDCAVTETQ